MSISEEDFRNYAKLHDFRVEARKTPVVIPVGYANVAVHWTRGTDPEDMLLTFGVSWTAPNHDSVASDVALAVANAIPAGSLGNQVHGTKVVARVRDENPDPVVQEAALNINGTQSGFNYTTQNVAGLWQKITAIGGRPGKGRLYWPFVLESDVDESGHVQSSTVTQWLGWANNLLTALADTSHGASTPMVILHSLRKSGVLPPPTPVTGMAVSAIAATQRRRMRP